MDARIQGETSTERNKTVGVNVKYCDSGIARVESQGELHPCEYSFPG